MIVALLAAVGTSSPTASLNISDCLAMTLAPLLHGAAPPSDNPYAAEMQSASAQSVGGLGNYLKCTRLVNGTERVANYALAQFTMHLVAGQAPASVNFGVCLPLSCSASSLKAGFKHDLPVAIAQNEAALNRVIFELELLQEATERIDLRNQTFAEVAAILHSVSPPVTLTLTRLPPSRI
jgi:hypothetical protein